MITLGIDLATVPQKTALCAIDWSVAPARIVRLENDGSDDALVRAAHDADVIAIDAPFGWPRRWADAVAAHRPGATFSAEGATSQLTSRQTDRWISEFTGVRPLAVGANLIGATAIRCARLVHEIGYRVDLGAVPVPPFVTEVYPAAALSVLGISYRLYKGKAVAAARVALLDQLVAAGLPIELDADGRRTMEASDDALDALICSLVGRAVIRRLTVDAPVEMAAAAVQEGWIRVPAQSTSLASLA